MGRQAATRPDDRGGEPQRPVRSEQPQRRCVICHTGRPTSELLRLSEAHGMVTLSTTRKGRSSYVCVQRRCLEALSARELRRDNKRVAGVAHAPSLLTQAHALAERRVLETLGLARRLGVLDHGVERVLGRKQGELAGVVVVASDLAARGQRKARGATVFLTSEALGRAAGLPPVGAVSIRGGRLAQQAAYWLALWCETDAHDRGREQSDRVAPSVGRSRS